MQVSAGGEVIESVREAKLFGNYGVAGTATLRREMDGSFTIELTVESLRAGTYRADVTLTDDDREGKRGIDVQVCETTIKTGETMQCETNIGRGFDGDWGGAQIVWVFNTDDGAPALALGRMSSVDR